MEYVQKLAWRCRRGTKELDVLMLKFLNEYYQGAPIELQHAFEHTKEVYVVWKPQMTPSPFITETATKIFSTVDEALTFFQEKGMVVQRGLFGN